MEDVMIFKSKYPLWHGLGIGHDFNRLGNPRQVERLALERVSRSFAGMVYRSGMVLIGKDTRLPHQAGGPESPRWCDWVKYALIQPSIPRTVNRDNIRFIIAILAVNTGELKLCGEPRLISQGLFALRQLKHEQHAFLFADAPINQTHEGHFGNGLVPKIQTPFDLY